MPPRPVLTPEEARDRRRKRMTEYHRKRRLMSRLQRASGPYEVHTGTDFVKPPDHVLLERDRRSQLQRTLTQEFFGDPLPGYSALDRRQR